MGQGYLLALGEGRLFAIQTATKRTSVVIQ